MNRKTLFIFFVTTGMFLSTFFADLRAENLYSTIRNHPNDVFVECGGTAAGQAIGWAWATGSKKVCMIDSNPILVGHVVHLFTDYFDRYPCYRPIPFSEWKPDLNFFIGDSASELKIIISDVNSSITFYLHSFIPDPDNTNATNNILMELTQICQHPIKTHTILIDNIDLAGTPLFGNVTLDAILDHLRLINSGYVFTFSDGGHLGKRPNAILIASPPK